MDTTDAESVSLQAMQDACEHWIRLEESIGQISTAHTPENATRMMSLLDRVLELAHRSPASVAVIRMRDFLTEWVVAYEAAHVPMEDLDPVDLLKQLMEFNNLRQRDLAAELGGQPNVSAILNRKRQINANQAFALGRRFAMAPTAFLPDPAAHKDGFVGGSWSASADGPNVKTLHIESGGQKPSIQVTDTTSFVTLIRYDLRSEAHH